MSPIVALSVVSLRCGIWSVIAAHIGPRVAIKLDLWGRALASQFAAELERQQLGDPKVVEAIKQMTKLHRNPLIHPEVILS